MEISLDWAASRKRTGAVPGEGASKAEARANWWDAAQARASRFFSGEELSPSGFAATTSPGAASSPLGAGGAGAAAAPRPLDLWHATLLMPSMPAGVPLYLLQLSQPTRADLIEWSREAPTTTPPWLPLFVRCLERVRNLLRSRAPPAVSSVTDSEAWQKAAQEQATELLNRERVPDVAGGGIPPPFEPKDLYKALRPWFNAKANARVQSLKVANLYLVLLFWHRRKLIEEQHMEDQLWGRTLLPRAEPLPEEREVEEEEEEVEEEAGRGAEGEEAERPPSPIAPPSTPVRPTPAPAVPFATPEPTPIVVTRPPPLAFTPGEVVEEEERPTSPISVSPVPETPPSPLLLVESPPPEEEVIQSEEPTPEPTPTTQPEGAQVFSDTELRDVGFLTPPPLESEEQRQLEASRHALELAAEEARATARALEEQARRQEEAEARARASAERLRMEEERARAQEALARAESDRLRMEEERARLREAELRLEGERLALAEARERQREREAAEDAWRRGEAARLRVLEAEAERQRIERETLARLAAVAANVPIKQEETIVLEEIQGPDVTTPPPTGNIPAPVLRPRTGPRILTPEEIARRTLGIVTQLSQAKEESLARADVQRAAILLERILRVDQEYRLLSPQAPDAVRRKALLAREGAVVQLADLVARIEEGSARWQDRPEYLRQPGFLSVQRALSLAKQAYADRLFMLSLYP